MRDYVKSAKLFTIEFSEVTRSCAVLVKEELRHIDIHAQLDGLTEEEKELIQEKQWLIRTLKRYRLNDYKYSIQTVSDDIVEALQDERRKRINGDNQWDKNTDHSTFVHPKTGDCFSRLLDDHDIRISARSAEDEYFAALERKEELMRDLERSRALKVAWDELKPEQRYILYMRYKEGATFESIGRSLGKTGNAVSQNHDTILKKLKRIMNRLGVK